MRNKNPKLTIAIVGALMPDIDDDDVKEKVGDVASKLANGIGDTSDLKLVVNDRVDIGAMSDFILVVNAENPIGDINDDSCLPVNDPGKLISFGMLVSFAITHYDLKN